MFTSLIPAQEKFPILRGDYLGQKRPGKVPEVFAHGLLSTSKHSAINSTNFIIKRINKYSGGYYVKKQNILSLPCIYISFLF